MSDNVVLVCKPLHMRSEAELMDYISEMGAKETMRQENRIQSMVSTFMEHWAATRNIPGYARPYTTAVVGTPAVCQASSPMATTTYREIRVNVPAFAHYDEARFLAERMIREQLGDMHLPWSTP